MVPDFEVGKEYSFQAGALIEENRLVNAAINKNMVRPRKKSNEDNRSPDCQDVVEADMYYFMFYGCDFV